MTLLTLAEARTVVDEILRHARENDMEPMTAVVLDAAGVVKATVREDGSGLARPDIAFAKAWGALGMGLPSRELARRSELMPTFFQALAPATQGRVIPVPGGALIVKNGQLVGAVGVSGDTSDNDELCAVAGVNSAGLLADVEATPKIRHSEF